MARQQYKTQPYMKHLEVFNDFSGGLNTSTTNDKLRDNELTDITNMNLGDRGSLKRRGGMYLHVLTGDTTPNTAQGYFRYYLNSNGYQEIVALGGKFFLFGDFKEIVGLPDGFQTDKPIEAVQFGKNMYFATGTDLVVYNGETFSVVEPYKPNPLEALYIGTNGLSDTPDQYLQDGVGMDFYIEGVTFNRRYGVVNEDFTLTAYSTIPDGWAVEYQFEWKPPGATDFSIVKEWSTSKTHSFRSHMEGDFQFRVKGRLQTTTGEQEYIVPKYTVKSTADPTDLAQGTSKVKKCNRILLHWGRLVLYGDTDNPDTVYFSHLNMPNYFPTTNNLQFLSPKREELTSLVQYRDMIVAFTATSIQALYGKSPADFRRVMLNTSIGCVAPYSPAVAGNYVIFLSREGVHYLKSLGYVDDKANVEKIDHKIDNILGYNTAMGGVFHDGQYYLTSPVEKRIYRLYTDTGAWTKDESPRLNFTRLFSYGTDVYGQDLDTGDVFVFNENAEDDAGIPFMDSFETKHFDFGQPYHRKKLKELQVLVSPKEETIKANIYAYADAALVLSPDESKAEIIDGNVVWSPSFVPNLVAYTGAKMGEWEMGNNPFGDVETFVDKLRISGNCYRTKIRVENGKHVLGFSYVFKVKKP